MALDRAEGGGGEGISAGKVAYVEISTGVCGYLRALLPAVDASRARARLCP